MRTSSSAETDWGEHRGDARAVGQAGVEQRPFLGDILAEGAGQIADGDLEVLFPNGHPGDRFEAPVAFDKNPPRAIDHHLRDCRVEDQRGDGPQKRQDRLEAHGRARSARGSGTAGVVARGDAMAGIGREVASGRVGESRAAICVSGCVVASHA
jgi:hypothetical protein